MKVKEELETRTHIKSEMLEISMEEQPNVIKNLNNRRMSKILT